MSQNCLDLSPSGQWHLTNPQVGTILELDSSTRSASAGFPSPPATRAEQSSPDSAHWAWLVGSVLTNYPNPNCSATLSPLSKALLADCAPAN